MILGQVSMPIPSVQSIYPRRLAMRSTLEHHIKDQIIEISKVSIYSSYRLFRAMQQRVRLCVAREVLTVHFRTR